MSKALNDRLGETGSIPKLTDTLPEIAPKQNDVPAKKKRRGASVFTYLAVLFAAAFLMLLMAYFVQQRNNDAMRLDMQEVLPTIEMAQRLQEENQRLEKENTFLQYQSKDQQRQIDHQQEELERIRAQLEDSETENHMLTASWYVEVLFQNGYYENCADLLRQYHHLALKPFSHSIDLYPHGTFIPLRELMNIEEKLVELGYMDETEVISIDESLLDTDAPPTEPVNPDFKKANEVIIHDISPT